MKRNMNVAPVILSGMMIASSVCGCGQAVETTATESTMPAVETTMGDSADTKSEPYDYTDAPAAVMEYEATEDSADMEEAYFEYDAVDNYAGEADAMFAAKNSAPYRYVPYYNTESYEKTEENGYSITVSKPLSTFAADVDTASYANIRRMIENGYTLSEINADAVRPEEFINYFSYELNNPTGKDKFGITTEITSCPWNSDHEIMFVGMKTRNIDLEEAPESNLVFLIDVSGSMCDDNKLPLLQKSFKELVDSLPDKGRVSIVTYSGSEKVVLSGESMAKKNKIKNAIDSLEADGCTNGEAGIQKAYEIAKNNYIEGGINRVILATDGDLNVGISSPEELEKFIKNKKDEGIFLSVLGFGYGNLKDDNLEKLADCGNGNYSYIDSLFEGKKVLVDEMGSTLVTVAKDVKLQVEFNPARVNSYRLIGYENRIMDDVDFNDDTKDGGEIGAGHSVVALYEIVPQGSEASINLKYQNTDQEEKNYTDNEYSSEYATVSVRYKEPDEDKSQLFSVVVDDSAYSESGSENIKFAGLVAEFAMILGDSEYKGTATLEDIMDGYQKLSVKDEYRDEFGQLVRMMAKRG